MFKTTKNPPVRAIDINAEDNAIVANINGTTFRVDMEGNVVVRSTNGHVQVRATPVTTGTGEVSVDADFNGATVDGVKVEQAPGQAAVVYTSGVVSLETVKPETFASTFCAGFKKAATRKVVAGALAATAAAAALGAGAYFASEYRDIKTPVAAENPDCIRIDYAGVFGFNSGSLYTTSADAPRPMSVAEATEYCAALNAKAVGGFTDWRLPTQEELDILFTSYDQGALKGTFNTTGEDIAMDGQIHSASLYRSSTPSAPYLSGEWAGTVTRDFKNSPVLNNPYGLTVDLTSHVKTSVRPVRADSTPRP